jgi:hypothetical protein
MGDEKIYLDLTKSAPDLLKNINQQIEFLVESRTENNDETIETDNDR